MCDRLVWNFHSEEFSNASLGLLGTALLLVALPGYADQSDPGPGRTGAAGRRRSHAKIRDLEDRVIAMEGQIRRFKD
jgi:hypothetical protein